MKYYVVDAFTNELFKGNPAGVCFLDKWLDDNTLQNIAAENNLSETAFLVKNDGYYELRWFTPSIEVDLCGHATLASGHVLFNHHSEKGSRITFKTKSGLMYVEKKENDLFLDFPARKAEPVMQYSTLNKAFMFENEGVFKAVDFLVVFKDEATLKSINPDFELLKGLKDEAGLTDDSFGIIVTAKGDNCDFVSRFFAPNAGINEDPVTGRAHCTLIPYWADVLGKNKMKAKQLSKRTGELICEYKNDRVLIGGKAVTYMVGDILIEGNGEK